MSLSKKIQFKPEVAGIISSTIIGGKTTLHCENAHSTFSVSIDKSFAIQPGCGDLLKYILIENMESGDLEIVPVAVEVKKMRTKLDFDCDSLYARIMPTNSEKKWRLPFIESEKEKFIRELSALTKELRGPRIQ